MDEGFSATRDALAAGLVDVAQARVVVAAVQGLPAAAVEADGSLVGRAEKHLLTLAEGTDSPGSGRPTPTPLLATGPATRPVTASPPTVKASRVSLGRVGSLVWMR